MPFYPPAGSGGGGGGSLIQKIALSSPSATIDFTGISGTAGTNLELVADLRGTVNPAFLVVNFNGDNGVNYQQQQQQNNAGVVATAFNGGNTSFQFQAVADPNASGVRASRFHMSIPNYASSVFDKTCRAETDADLGTTSGSITLWNFTATWRPASPTPITRITLGPNVGQWATGCVACLYAFA